MKKTIFMYIEIILFSVFVMCIIILGCNREYFLDNTQIDTETVMTSEEQSESSVHLVNNTTSEIIWTEIIFVAKKVMKLYLSEWVIYVKKINRIP